MSDLADSSLVQFASTMRREIEGAAYGLEAKLRAHCDQRVIADADNQLRDAWERRDAILIEATRRGLFPVSSTLEGKRDA